MKILLFAAMSSERALFARLLGCPHADANALAGRIGNSQVRVVETGIGKVNAAIGATMALKDNLPDIAISSGVAGGLVPNVSPGDVVAASAVAYHDVWCGEPNKRGQVQGMPLRFETEPWLLAAASGSLKGKTGSSPKIGTMASGDEFIQTPERRNAVLSIVPDAVAVDMESGALAQTCYVFGVPFLSLRVISDSPGASPDHAAQYENFWQTLAERSFETVRGILCAVSDSLADFRGA